MTTAIMTNDVSISAPRIHSLAHIDAMHKMCAIAARSGLISSNSNSLAQREADAFVVMAYGVELGIPPITALKTIYVIDGKPSASGQAMLALARRGGVDIRLPDPGSVKTQATVAIKRPRSDEWVEYSYTMDMANKAGLTGKNNWKKHPAEMLIWRAVATAIRFQASDIVGGLYTVEEISPDMEVDEYGTPIGGIVQSSAQPVEQPRSVHYLETEAGKERLKRVLREVGAVSNDERNDYVAIVKLIEPDRELTAFSETTLSEEDLHKRIRAVAPKVVKKTEKAGKQADSGASFDEGGAGTVEPPEDDEPAQSPSAFTWTEFDLHMINEEAEEYYLLKPDEAQELVGKEWTAFGSLDAARSALLNAVITSGSSLVASNAVYNGQYTEFDTRPPTRLYGRDKLRDLGEEWKEAVDAWTKGGEYELPYPIVVDKWERAKNGRSFIAEEIRINIPF